MASTAFLAVCMAGLTGGTVVLIKAGFELAYSAWTLPHFWLVHRVLATLAALVFALLAFVMFSVLVLQPIREKFWQRGAD